VGRGSPSVTMPKALPSRCWSSPSHRFVFAPRRKSTLPLRGAYGAPAARRVLNGRQCRVGPAPIVRAPEICVGLIGGCL
jgi:hypothetical protein